MFYKDLRIRNSNRSSLVPRCYKSYIFRYAIFDTTVYKVVLAPSLVVAHQRVKEFCVEQGLDPFWQFVAEDDFEIAYLDNNIPFK